MGNIANKVEKLLKLRPEFIINKYYFNPAMAEELFQQAKLEDLGLVVSQTEVETEDGLIVRSIISGHGELPLGSLLLDGESVQIRRKLTPVSRLLRYLEMAEGIVAHTAFQVKARVWKAATKRKGERNDQESQRIPPAHYPS